MKFDIGKIDLPFQKLKDHKMFERVCFRAYSALWNDRNAIFVGSEGKKQFGLDIVGYDHHAQKRIGVQCKNYKSNLASADIKDIIALVDADNRFSIDHLVIAIPRDGTASIQAEVTRLTDSRRNIGKFTVSIEHTAEIAANLGYDDIDSVVRSFPDLFPGMGHGLLKRLHPLEDGLLQSLNAINKFPGVDTIQHHKFSFQRWIENDCFSSKPHAINNNTYLSVPGYDPEHFCFRVYVKDKSSYYRDCERTVDIEGFDLLYSNDKVRDMNWIAISKLESQSNRHLDRREKDSLDYDQQLAVRAGFFENAVDQVAHALRTTGCVRWVWPKSCDSIYDEVLEQRCGFVEHKDRDILVLTL
jgi:hypothetical protein